MDAFNDFFNLSRVRQNTLLVATVKDTVGTHVNPVTNHATKQYELFISNLKGHHLVFILRVRFYDRVTKVCKQILDNLSNSYYC